MYCYGGCSHARRTNWAKKLVVERPKTKLAESQFSKIINCHSIKRELTEAIFCFFHNETLEIQNLFQFGGGQ